MQLTTKATEYSNNPELDLHYYFDIFPPECHAVIYVVDSGDRERVEESKAAFDKMIKNETIKGIPLLVAANKQDLADCMGVREVKHLFENNVEGGCQQQQYHNLIIITNTHVHEHNCIPATRVVVGWIAYSPSPVCNHAIVTQPLG